MPHHLKGKISFTLILILAASLLFACSDEKTDTENVPDLNNSPKKFSIADKKIFGVKSGLIEYQITGSQEGAKKLYFDDWGRRQAEFSNSTISVGRYSKHSSILKLSLNDDQYVINLENKTGTKRENPLIDKMRELDNQVNFGEFGEQLILIDGGFEAGSEEVFGRKCNVYRFSKLNQTLWVWNWILLKSEINQGRVNIKTEAVNIATDINIDEKIFSVPPDILITEIDLESLRDREKDIPLNP